MKFLKRKTERGEENFVSASSKSNRRLLWRCTWDNDDEIKTSDRLAEDLSTL